MKCEIFKDPLTHNIELNLKLTGLDLVKSEIPRALREWYESLKNPSMSDELFYVSEIVKGLGK